MTISCRVDSGDVYLHIKSHLCTFSWHFFFCPQVPLRPHFDTGDSAEHPYKQTGLIPFKESRINFPKFFPRVVKSLISRPRKRKKLIFLPFGPVEVAVLADP